MRRRDFFGSCVAAVATCALPAPVATAGCITITAIDFYAGTITISGGPGSGRVEADQYLFLNRGESTRFQVGAPMRCSIEELT